MNQNFGLFRSIMRSLGVLALLCSLTNAKNIPSRTPRKVILCDIHDVLLSKPRTGKVIKTLWKKKKFLRAAKPIWKIVRRGDMDGKGAHLIAVAHKYNCPELADMCMRMETTDRKPFHQVIDTLRQLRQQGYELIIASNITRFSYEYTLRPGTRAHAKFPFFAELFTGVHGVVDAGDALDKEPIRKPHREYFDRLLKDNNLDPNFDTIYFLDDKPRNFAGAIQAGIPAHNCIHVTSEKQLVIELKKGLMYMDDKVFRQNSTPTMA